MCWVRIRQMRNFSTPESFAPNSARVWCTYELAALRAQAYHPPMTQSLQRFLGHGSALERLQDHARQLMKLQTLLGRLLPAHLVEGVSVGNLKDGTLVLLARNGAIAVKLKQIAPSLIRRLGEQGILITQIQVKVQMRPPAPPPRHTEPRIIGSEGRRSLEAFVASLPEGAPLRDSFEKLLERSQPPSTPG